MYLLYRHPLRGGKIHDMDDPQKDENSGMGQRHYSSNIRQTTPTVFVLIN
jgi:hypothetical protein